MSAGLLNHISCLLTAVDDHDRPHRQHQLNNLAAVAPHRQRGNLQRGNLQNTHLRRCPINHGHRGRATTRSERAATRQPLSSKSRPWVAEAGPRPWSNHLMILDVAEHNLGHQSCKIGPDSTCSTAYKTLEAMTPRLSDENSGSSTSGGITPRSPKCGSSCPRSASTQSDLA